MNLINKIKFFKSYKILKSLKNQNLNFGFFYTSCFNLDFILKSNIKTINYIFLKKNEKYIIWGYSQGFNYLKIDTDYNLDFGFWNWFKNKNLELNDVLVICFNLFELLKNLKNNWNLLSNNSLKINESIFLRSEFIHWILLRNKKLINNNLIKIIKEKNINFYFCNKGNIKKLN